jgi:hypothetical protein
VAKATAGRRRSQKGIAILATSIDLKIAANVQESFSSVVAPPDAVPIGIDRVTASLPERVASKPRQHLWDDLTDVFRVEG